MNHLVTDSNILECCGELLFVRIGFGGSNMNTVTEVHVHKLDFDRMIWEKTHSLMGQAVILHGLGASSCPAFGDGIIEADTLYFTSSPEFGLFSFNVKDGCLSIHLPCEDLPESLRCYPVVVVPHDVRLSCTQEKQGEEVNEKENSSIIAKGKTFSVITIDSETEISNYSLSPSGDFHFHPSSSSPIWLLLPTNGMTGFKFVDPVHGSSFHMSVPESLRGSVVRCSRNGWLLMCDEKSSVSFFNPFTDEIIKLTDEKECIASRVMAFSSLPTSSDCIVVACSSCSWEDSSILHVLSAKMGDGYRWQDDTLEGDSKFWLSNINSPLFYKGSFYLLGQDENLSTLKYEEEETDLQEGIGRNLSWKVLKEIEKPGICKCYHQSCLVECDGKLMSIFVDVNDPRLRLFSLNFDAMCWEEVSNIGNYVIYVSPSSCVSKEASIVGTENRIYLPRFRGNSIFYYSLETRKFHVNAEETLDSFYDTKEALMATWIEAIF